jgi:hypothetical protein
LFYFEILVNNFIPCLNYFTNNFSVFLFLFFLKGQLLCIFGAENLSLILGGLKGWLFSCYLLAIINYLKCSLGYIWLNWWLNYPAFKTPWAKKVEFWIIDNSSLLWTLYYHRWAGCSYFSPCKSGLAYGNGFKPLSL